MDDYIPVERELYFYWLLNQLNKLDMQEVSYKDYKYDLLTRSSSFDDLFYLLDFSLKSIRSESNEPLDFGDRVEDQRSFVEYRHNCERDYPSMNELVRVLIVKTDVWLTHIDSLHPVTKRVVVNKHSDLFTDVQRVLETLLQRYYDNTF